MGLIQGISASNVLTGGPPFSPADLNPYQWCYAGHPFNTVDDDNLVRFAGAFSATVPKGFYQSNHTYQPTHVTIAGKLAPYLVTPFRYPLDTASTGSAKSEQRSLTNGAGCTLVMVGYQNDAGGTNAVLVNSFGSNNTLAGIDIRRTSADKLKVEIGNGSSNIFSQTSSATFFSANARRIVVYRYSETSPLATDIDVRLNGTSIIAANTTGTPSSGDPQNTLSLGVTAGNTTWFNGAFVEFIWYNSFLSNSDVAALEDWCARWPATATW